LWLFFLLVFGIIALPGMDMAYVMASAISGGTARGFSAVGGIVTGGAVHVLIATLGIGIIIETAPGAYKALLALGSAYTAWVGYQLYKGAGLPSDPHSRGSAGLWATFRRALVTCLLNPKAYLFMLAIFPQFLRPEYGRIVSQAVVLGAIIALTQATIYGAVVWGAATVRTSLLSKPRLLMRIGQGFGLILAAAALWSGLHVWL
jgi:threonine/homoserine/homoserine lactone efflux protein